MLAKQAAAVLALTAATSAFLIPPELSASDINDAMQNLRTSAVIVPDHERVVVDCPGCPVPVFNPGRPRVWSHDIPSQLELNFDVTDFRGEERTGLLLNGGLIYPWKDATKAGPAIQVTSSDDKNEVHWGVELNYASKPIEEEHEFGLITITMDIFELDGQPVSGIDTVTVNVVSTPNGHLYIAKTSTTPFAKTGHVHAGPKCVSLACKFKAFIDAKLAEIPKVHAKPKRPCGKKMSPFGFPSGAPRPHHHHGHKHHSAFMRSLRFTLNGAAHVAIFIATGLAMGVVAYFAGALIGMLVGNFVILLWRVFYRRGQKGSCCRLAVDNPEPMASELDGESKPFIDNQEPPPVYEDVASEKSGL